VIVFVRDILPVDCGKVGPRAVTRRHVICTLRHECSGVMMSAAPVSAGVLSTPSSTSHR